MKRKSTDQLLADYRATAVVHGRALQEGPARTCNRAYDKLARIRRELRERGDSHLQRVRELFDDDDPAVRRSAGVDALEFAPDEGLRVLREVAAGPPGMVQFDAEMVLQQWETGEWDTSTP